MSSQNELLLEHRVSETELETIRLRRQVEELTAQVRRLAQAPAPLPTKSYQPPAERTTIHQTRHYDFEARLPPARLVVDFFSRNKNTNDVVHIGYFSPTQIERACQKFSRLQFPTRKLWKGNTRLYSVARRLFAQHGAIQQHTGSRVWHWAAYPGERRACAARIVAGLSPKN